MSVTIHIPTILRTLTNGERSVQATGSTLQEVIAALDKAYPGTEQRLIKDHALVRFMNVYVNDADVRFADGLNTAVRDGDQISIIPAVAGG